MKKRTKETIGFRLRTIRELKGISQLEASAELERRYPDLSFGNANLSRWESGETDPPLNKLRALAEFYDVSLDYVFGITDKPNRITIEELKGLGVEWLEIAKDLSVSGLGADDVRRLTEILIKSKKGR